MKAKKKMRWLAVLLALCMVMVAVPMHTYATTMVLQAETNTKDDLIVQEPESKDTVINLVDIGNIWTKLNASQPFAFTGEVNPNSECVNQMEIASERWSAIDRPPVYSTDDYSNKYPEAGFTYYYGIELRAKDGYVFSSDYNDINKYVMSGKPDTGSVCFIYDGNYYKSEYVYVSEDGKTLSLGISDLTTVAGSGSADDTVIKDVELSEKAGVSYNAGDKPQGIAGRSGENAPNYEISYECWEEMEKTDNGLEPAAFWYSDESKYTAATPRFTKFEAGKSYMYSIELKAVNGRTFASTDTGLSVKFADKYVDLRNVTVSQDGTTLFAVAVKTVKPVALKEIELIEINGATMSFNAGDKPVFTGSVADDAVYYIDHEGWMSENGGITSSDFWNGRYGDFEGSWGKLITEFKSGEKYVYNIYVKLSSAGYDGNYIFGKNTKLSINGKIMDVAAESISLDPEGETIWFYNVATVEIPDNGGDNKPSGDNNNNGGNNTPSGDNNNNGGNNTPSGDNNNNGGSNKPSGDNTNNGGSNTSSGDNTNNSGNNTPSGDNTNNSGNNISSSDSSTAVSDTNNTTTEATTPKTGDNSGLYVWYIILVAAISVITIAAICRKKENNY